MADPWTAEREVGIDEARILIESQFAELAPARLEPFGVGWDNIAYLVNGEFVFRIPRRKIGAELMASEVRVLPAIGPRLPLEIPVPRFVGAIDGWPFAGYRKLAGVTACRANLDDAQRCAAAEPLGRFLAALHAIADSGAGPDTMARLDVERRRALIREHLARVVDDPKRFEPVMDAASGLKPARTTLAHGDLYARHLIVDAAGRLTGVIDWGDVHVGNPAVDLSIAWALLPKAAHDAFRHAYGPIAETEWTQARFKAMLTATMIASYGTSTGDADLVREGLWTLRTVAP